MKKMVAVILLAIVIIGCGPKMAKQETLDALNEARAALEAAQTRISELQGEIDALKARKAQLEEEISGLEAEVQALQEKIDTRCKK
ncbi:MAG TPA: hypothetical protein ENI34_06530 [candidate division WOR-3 bacterium]|uniref:Uncharacterized protein n=1 Tax=candidate division WOR-3 bacterium TaxID=2052148 RepID=A0A9C9EMZ2_UNCW3|nr:hypothetical protein [candidate division WOR-3 bacterium]